QRHLLSDLGAAALDAVGRLVLSHGLRVRGNARGAVPERVPPRLPRSRPRPRRHLHRDRRRDLALELPTSPPHRRPPPDGGMMATADVLRARLETVPRVALAHLPTPLEEMPKLAAALDGPRLWVKRDDCTGLGIGGNKVRKLEYDLAAALAVGADCVVC